MFGLAFFIVTLYYAERFAHGPVAMGLALDYVDLIVSLQVTSLLTERALRVLHVD